MRLEHIYHYVFSEDLDAKIPELLKQFKNISPEEAEATIRRIAEADPTETKNYTPWLCKQFIKNNIRLPEDQERVLEALRLFDQNKRRAGFTGPKDIFGYKAFSDLEDVTDTLKGQELKSKRQAKREVKEKGASLVYDDGTYAVVQIVEPAAAAIYGAGSRWCTSNAGTAGSYLTGATYKGSATVAPLHVIFKDGVKILQLHAASDQLKDLKDVQFDWSKGGSIVARTGETGEGGKPAEDVVQVSSGDIRKILSKVIVPTNATSAWLLTRASGKRTPEAEAAIAQDPNHSVDYAIDVVKGRWPAAEPALLKSLTTGYYGSIPAIKYASQAIKGRWPELEDAIERIDARHRPQLQLKYVLNVIKDRVPEMESSIMADPAAAVEYAISCVHGRWPEAEESILLNSKNTHNGFDPAIKYASWMEQRWPELERTLIQSGPDNVHSIIKYADTMIGDRWPEAEPVIAASKEMLNYAEKYVKGPWPEVEKAIMKSTSENIFKYILNVLKGPWPYFENALQRSLTRLPAGSDAWRDVARLAFKYSRDVKNGSWPEIEKLLAADPDFFELYKNNIGLRRKSGS